MKRTLLLAIALVNFAACRDTLDLDAGECFGVKELLHSKNAAVKCNERADFENRVLCLDGEVVAEMEIRATRQFVLRDVDDSQTSITVTIDSAIVNQVANLIRVRGNSRATVTGVVSGFDMPGNLKCRRGFTQHIERLEDLVFP